MRTSRTLVSALASVAAALAGAAALPAPAQAAALAPTGPSGPATRTVAVSTATVEGTLRRVVVDDADEFGLGRGATTAARPAAHGLHTVTVVEVGRKLVRVPDALAAGTANGRRVRLGLSAPRAGLSAGQVLAAGTVAGTGAGVTSLTPVAASSLPSGTTVAGAHTLTILPVYWGSKDSATVASLTTLAQRTADYWRQQSAGKVTTSIAVRDWKQVTNPGSCDYTGLYSAALAAHGVSAPSGTDHVLIYFPYRSDCSWAGLAYVGGNVIWDNGYDLLDVTAHEFGHNLGLGHANTATCTGSSGRVPLSSSCTLKEYYDSADVMGYATYSDTGSLNVGFANYLGLATVTSIDPSATSATTVNLAALQTYSGTRGVKIPVSGGNVYVEFRPASGRDVRQATWAGVQVRMITSDSPPTSRLLDMQPWDSAAFATSGSAVAMQPYYVWPVPGTSVAVKVTQVGTTATVAVVPTKGDTTKPGAAVLVSPGPNSKVPSLATVTWTAATDTGGAGMGAYAVLVDGTVAARVSGDATSASLTGVGSGSHTVRVDAYDNAGNVTTGTAVTATVDPNATGSPARITAPVANALTQGSPTVSWVLDTPAATSVVLVDGAEATRTTGTSASVGPLTDGTHTVAIRTLDGDGLTLATSTAVTFKSDGTAPTAASGLKVAVVKGSALLSWTAAKDAVGVLGYDVRLDGTLLGRTASSSYTTSLPSGSHVWSVTSVDKAGNTGSAATLTALTDATAGSAPTITSPSSGAVFTTGAQTVTFTGSTDSDTGIVGYRLSIDGAAAKTLLAADATCAAVTLRDGTHRIVVSAINGAGLAAESTPVTVTVDSAAPTQPSRVALSGSTLSWTASSDRVSGLASYRVLLDGSAYATAASSATSATVTTPNGRHIWSVAAVDAAGNVSKAGAATAVWKDPSAPSAPTLLTPADSATLAKKSVTATWSPATDDDSGILGYKIVVNGVAATRLTSGTAKSASVTLVPGQNVVKVSAVNLAGVEGAASTATVLVDTTGATPPVITSPGSTTARQFTVTWDAATDADSGVSGYTVLLNGRAVTTVAGSVTSADVTWTSTATSPVAITVQARNGAGLLTNSVAVKTTVTSGVVVRGAWLRRAV